ncbi:hypothetical protein HK102_007296, partial [Quaeritorhiza haematococci]
IIVKLFSCTIDSAVIIVVVVVNVTAFGKSKCRRIPKTFTQQQQQRQHEQLRKFLQQPHFSELQHCKQQQQSQQ